MAEREIFGERYAVYEEIASGGMASVYLAAPIGPAPDVPPVVALKKLAPEFSKQPDFVAMFLDEAHLAARVRHRNVVTTYEFLRTQSGLGIVMDLVVGESLRKLMYHSDTAMERLPIPVATAVVIGALEGLHCAHEATDATGKPLHLVHRDVSPHNILVGADGVARVIDFGVAKAIGRLQTSDLGVLKGKFAYMAPEQIRGASIDRRADVYAAGIVLWETLTGTNLFRSTPNQALLDQRGSGQTPIVPPSLSCDAVTPTLDAIVLRALEHDPVKRFATAQEMADIMRARLEVADDATVAAWVHRRAGGRIEALEAQLRRIEASVGKSRQGSRVVVTTAIPGDPAGNTIPVVDIPDAEVEESESRPGDPSVAPMAAPTVAQVEVSSVPPLEPVVDEPINAAPPPPTSGQGKFRANITLEDHSADGIETLSGVDLVPIPSAVQKGQAARVVRPRMPPALRKRPRMRRWPLVLLFVVLPLLGLAGALAMRGPQLIKARVIAAAARHGVALSVERIEPTRSGLTLRGVSATLTRCPSLRATAAEATLDLDATLTTERVIVPGYELTVTAGPSQLADELRAWQRGAFQPLAVEAKAGHVVWTSSTSPGLVLEALDVSFNAGATPGSATSVDTANLLINLPRGHAGPWRGHLESTGPETRVRIGLDAANPDGVPSATYVDRRIEGSSWSVDIPRGSTFKIGVPADALGLQRDLSLEVALRGHMPPSGANFEAEGHVGVYGLELGAARAARGPVDIVVRGKVAGDPSRPLVLEGGEMTTGKGAIPVTGTLSIEADGARVVVDRRSTKGEALAPLVLDTRDWTRPASGGQPAHPSTQGPAR